MQISVSRVRAFKSCRRMYELKYLEGLQPDTVSEALEVGSTYHELLEDIYTNKGAGNFGYNKASAMAEAYINYILPEIPEMKYTEEWFEYPLVDDVTLVGRIDGVMRNGLLIEHKTTSLSLEEFDYNLQWDEQVLAYMLATGERRMVFTVCRKPTIRQRKTESEEDFYRRMVDWYAVDTDEKIGLIVVERSDAEITEYEEELKKMAQEMQTDNFYRNTSHCRCWRRRCEYAPVCLAYDPEQEYFGFTKEIENENNKTR